MGKASKWLRGLLIGKKEKEKEKVKAGNLTIGLTAENRSVPATKEKRRWSFRRSVGTAKDLNSTEPRISVPCRELLFDSEIDQKRQAMVVAVATAAAADAAVAAAQAAAAVVRLTAVANGRKTRFAFEEAAAVRIQSVFRSYLARKALCALKGLVKLQALVRGHLVRKQATATLRCMQALANAQARARAKRIGMIEESQAISQRQQNYRRSPQHSRFRKSFEMNRNEDEYVKIVEMDLGETRSTSKGRSSYSVGQTESIDQMFSIYNKAICRPSKADLPPQFSPAPSTLTEMNPMSPRAHSGHFEEFSFATAQNSPHLSAMSMPTQNSFDYPMYPNYMANTESFRAKVRSQSAPRPRIDTYERQSSRKRPSVEGRNIPRGIRMQRSSSHVGLTANSYQYPWSIKFDKSNMSLKESECGSTSTVLTNSNYCRSLVGYEVHGNNY
ncbi:hypothetical protein M5K25_005544 [Dendrobium thyrsiflorum]|uniref:DUF4005 domain-containing protein n=1 Tax=Dendrobium thyrsiflorum TaxID=117978 RepID=A0ABD0VHW3_DENTH